MKRDLKIDEAGNADRAADRFVSAGQIDARLAAAQRHVDKFTPSFPADAFCGHLVPQAPNEETASALQERIRVQSRDTTTPPKQ